MICPACLSREYGSEEGKDALVAYLYQQLDRLSSLAYGIPFTRPDAQATPVVEPAAKPEPPRSTLFVLESVLASEDVFRKPPRVAAPRVIDRLAAAGLFLTHDDGEKSDE